MVKPPKFFRKSEENLSRKNRCLSKKEKGSRRWLRARKRLSRTHARIKRQRLDFLHKVTTKLANDHEAISVEALAIKNMSKNRSLAKGIMDASWGMIYDLLEYKLRLRGKSFRDCGGNFPSTQLCSTCDNKTGPKSIKDLNVRIWRCSTCHTDHDRDINAAKNIGLRGDDFYHHRKAA